MTPEQFVNHVHRKQAEYLALRAVLADVLTSLPRERRPACLAAIAVRAQQDPPDPRLPDIDAAITEVLQDIATAMEHLLLAMQAMLAHARISN